MVETYNNCSIDNKNKDNIINLSQNNIKLNYIGSPYDEENEREIPIIKLEDIRTTLDDTTSQYNMERQRNITSEGNPLDIDIQLFTNNNELFDGILDGGNSIDTKYGIFTVNIEIPDINIPIDSDTGKKVKLWIAPWMYDKYPDTRPEQGYITTEGDNNNIESPSSLTWLEFNKGFDNTLNRTDIIDNDHMMFDEKAPIINSDNSGKYYGIFNNNNIHTLWFKRNAITNPLYSDESQWQGYINPLVIFLTYGRDIDEANRNYLYGCSNIIKIQLRTERCLEGWSGFPDCNTQCCRSETFPQCKITEDNIINIRDYELREFSENDENGRVEGCFVEIGKECSTNKDAGELIDIKIGDSIMVDLEILWNYYYADYEIISNMKGKMNNIIVSEITSTNKYIFNFDNINCQNYKLYDNNGELMPVSSCKDSALLFVSGIGNLGLNKQNILSKSNLGSTINELIDLNVKLDNIGLDCNGGLGNIIPIKKFDRNTCAKLYCEEKSGEFIPEKISYTCFEDLTENNRFSEVSDAESYCNLEVTAGVDLSLADAGLMQSGAANLIQSYNNCNYDSSIKTGLNSEKGECIERRCPKGKFGKNCDNNCCGGVCVWPEKYNNPLLGEYKTYKEWCTDKKIDPIIPPQRCGCSFDPNELTLEGTSPPEFPVNVGSYQICTNSSQCNTLPEQERVWTDIAVNINNRNWADSDEAREDVKNWGRMQKEGAVESSPASGDWGCGKAQVYVDGSDGSEEFGSGEDDMYNKKFSSDETIFLGCEPVWAPDSNKCQYYPNAENSGNGGTSEGLDEKGNIIKTEVCTQCLEGWYGPECNMKCCGGLCSKTVDEKDCAEQSRDSNELCDFYPSINMCLSSCQGENREDCVSTRGCRWGTDYEEGLKTSPTGDPNDGDIGPFCLNNECTCLNGTPAKGLQCPMHNSESCTSCDKGYGKVYGRGEEMSNYFICRPNGLTNLLDWYLGLIEWDKIQTDFFSEDRVGPIRVGIFSSIVVSSISSIIIFVLLFKLVKDLEYFQPFSFFISCIIILILMVICFCAYYGPLVFYNDIWIKIPKIPIPGPFSIGGGVRIETGFLLFRSLYFVMIPILSAIILIMVLLVIVSQLLNIFS